jgi:uncharacterized protein (DUF433 family)
MKQSEPVIHINPEILGGTAVFVGTRVPFETRLDYLKGGQPLSEFLKTSRRSHRNRFSQR